MSNIKVVLKKALEDSRAVRQSSEVMTVASVTFKNGQYQHRLVGQGKTLIRTMKTSFRVGDQLVVSDGDVIGRSSHSGNAVFLV